LDGKYLTPLSAKNNGRHPGYVVVCGTFTIKLSRDRKQSKEIRKIAKVELWVKQRNFGLHNLSRFHAFGGRKLNNGQLDNAADSATHSILPLISITQQPRRVSFGSC